MDQLNLIPGNLYLFIDNLDSVDFLRDILSFVNLKNSAILIQGFGETLSYWSIGIEVERLRLMAEQRKISFILITHSLIVLDNFSHIPENIFFQQSRCSKEFFRLTDRFSKEYLAHFNLSDLWKSEFSE